MHGAMGPIVMVVLLIAIVISWRQSDLRVDIREWWNERHRPHPRFWRNSTRFPILPTIMVEWGMVCRGVYVTWLRWSAGLLWHVYDRESAWPKLVKYTMEPANQSLTSASHACKPAKPGTARHATGSRASQTGTTGRGAS